MSPEEKFGPIVIVKCCRLWPVFVLFGWGRCGLCGTRPVRDAE